LPLDVVITGFGGCTCLGAVFEAFPNRSEEYPGPSDVLSRVPISLDLGGGEEAMAAVHGPDPESIPGLRRPYPDRPTLMSFVAADRAITCASLDTVGVRGAEIGLVVNTCFGPSHTVERYLRTLLTVGPAQVSAIAFSRAVSNSVAGEIARRHHLRGPCTAVLGSSALGYGIDLLRDGAARAVLCLGVDEVRDLHLWAYRQSGLLDDGLWLGEGAAAVVLEKREDANARCASILGIITGYATGFCSASVHRITDVTRISIESCMNAALANAHRDPQVVDYVIGLANGHTGLVDVERQAVRHLLGREPSWVWPKFVYGETFGASEPIALAVASATLCKRKESQATALTCLVNACHIGGGISSIVMESAP